jgi:hypothetical protein
MSFAKEIKVGQGSSDKAAEHAGKDPSCMAPRCQSRHHHARDDQEQYPTRPDIVVPRLLDKYGDPFLPTRGRVLRIPEDPLVCTGGAGTFSQAFPHPAPDFIKAPQCKDCGDDAYCRK